MTLRQTVFIATVLIAASATLAGCGRKGDLLTPSEAAIEARKEAQDAGEPLPPEPAPVVKDRRFILDGLIE